MKVTEANGQPVAKLSDAGGKIMRSNTLITEFIETLDDLNLNGKMIPGLIMSSPGFGKTSTVELYCKVKDYNCCTLIPSHYSPDDILGLQSLVNGELVRLTPSWYKTLLDMASEKRTLLFIDELSTCDEFIQAPLLRLVFERKLDDKPLPDNVFIVSAGNYANELNNQFHLAAPTVNRFMVLNLSSSDYDIMEVCDDKFSHLAKSDDIKSITSYLNTSRVGDTKKWKFSKIRDFISKHIQFSKPAITDSTEDGLIGYCSIRSLSYTLSFIQSYVNSYNGDLWIRVAGDTLGTYREKPLRGYFEQNRELFILMNQSSSENEDTFNLKNKIANFFMDSNSKVRQSEIADIVSWMKSTDKNHVTPVDIDTLRKFALQISSEKYKSNCKFNKATLGLIDEVKNLYDSKFDKR